MSINILINEIMTNNVNFKNYAHNVKFTGHV